MTEETPPEAVREFAKSFQALLNVVSPGVGGRVPEQSEEMKAGMIVQDYEKNLTGFLF